MYVYAFIKIEIIFVKWIYFYFKTGRSVAAKASDRPLKRVPCVLERACKPPTVLLQSYAGQKPSHIKVVAERLGLAKVNQHLRAHALDTFAIFHFVHSSEWSPSMH